MGLPTLRLRRGSASFWVSRCRVERANPVDEEQILIAAASPGDTFRKYEGKQAFGQPILRVFDHRNRGNPAIVEENDVTDFDERAMLKLGWGRRIVAERERIG